MLEHFHFLRPLWLLALPAFLAMVVVLWRIKKHGAGTWHAVCDAHLLPFILDHGSPRAAAWRWLAVILAGTLAITALAGPAWRQVPQPLFRQQMALVVALDLSRSMLAEDLQPNRLVRARLKLLDLLDQRGEGQTALLVYAGDAFTVTPLTDDVATIAALVPSLSTTIMPLQGSRTDRALKHALRLLEQSGAGVGAVLLITDGVNATGLDAALKGLRHRGATVSVIGVGTPEGAPIRDGDGGFVKDADGQVVVPGLEEDALRALARSGGGRYARLAIDNSDIRIVLGDRSPSGSDALDETELTTTVWREEGPALLLVLLPLAALAFRRGFLACLAVALLPWSPPADAWDWPAWLLNSDQRGARAMQAQDYTAALQQFTDPRWRAAAAYRAKDYLQALAELDALHGVADQYNRGNALARLGKIDEAMAAYQDVLKREPGHADARRNLELLKSLQEEQSDAQDQQGQSGQGDEGRAGEGEQAGEPSPSGQQDSGADQGARADSGDAPAATDGQHPEESPGRDAPAVDAAESEKPDDGREEQLAARPDYDEENEEERQATEQWLRRIPDDPGGLLRRKFRYQYSRRYTDAPHAERPW